MPCRGVGDGSLQLAASQSMRVSTKDQTAEDGPLPTPSCERARTRTLSSEPLSSSAPFVNPGEVPRGNVHTLPEGMVFKDVRDRSGIYT